MLVEVSELRYVLGSEYNSHCCSVLVLYVKCFGLIVQRSGR